jgi:hypothetical protein
MVPGRTPQPQPNRRSDHQPNIRAGQGEQEPVITRAAHSEPVALGEHADDRRRPLRQRPAAIRALPPGTALLLATGIKPALIHLTPWYLGPRAGEITAAQGAIELFTRRLERVSTQFPDVLEVLRAGLSPSEAIVEGEVVAFDPSAGELRPFQEVMFRRRKHGIPDAVRDVPVGLFCSPFALASTLPSGLNATPLTSWAPAWRGAPAGCLVTGFHSRTVPSLSALASSGPARPAIADSTMKLQPGVICKTMRTRLGFPPGQRG